MNTSICKFMPAKHNTGDIKIIHFVYESEMNVLKQPFIHPIHYIHLVTGGTGILKIANAEYHLKRGSLFFAYPGCPYEISDNCNLTYFYISFMGTGAASLLANLDIDISRPAYTGFEHVIDFWQDSIKRINQLNANILSESVLLYTLSFINNTAQNIQLNKNNENLFETIVAYVDEHYRENDMSLNKVAGLFSYTEKYLSSLFKKKMNVGFNHYLNVSVK